MRAYFSLALIAVSACATSSAEVPAPTIFPPAPPAPLAAQPQLPELIKGRVAIVDLWASWCTACVETASKLRRLEENYGPKGLVVAGVSVGESPEKATEFAKSAGITYPLYADPEFLFADGLAAREVPTILVVDREGNIVARAHTLDRDVLEIVKQLLSVQGE